MTETTLIKKKYPNCVLFFRAGDCHVNHLITTFCVFQKRYTARFFFAIIAISCLTNAVAIVQLGHDRKTKQLQASQDHANPGVREFAQKREYDGVRGIVRAGR